jgi:hypothetical protein
LLHLGWLSRQKYHLTPWSENYGIEFNQTIKPTLQDVVGKFFLLYSEMNHQFWYRKIVKFNTQGDPHG